MGVKKSRYQKYTVAIVVMPWLFILAMPLYVFYFAFAVGFALYLETCGNKKAHWAF